MITQHKNNRPDFGTVAIFVALGLGFVLVLIGQRTAPTMLRTATIMAKKNNALYVDSNDDSIVDRKLECRDTAFYKRALPGNHIEYTADRDGVLVVCPYVDTVRARNR